MSECVAPRPRKAVRSRSPDVAAVLFGDAAPATPPPPAEEEAPAPPPPSTAPAPVDLFDALLDAPATAVSGTAHATASDAAQDDVQSAAQELAERVAAAAVQHARVRFTRRRMSVPFPPPCSQLPQDTRTHEHT